ncbi:MAG: hypothetical protein IT584_00150 [Chlamydiae bacterium]|nr:hypothetical protein [Chlamydiota bacterium]
MIRPFSLLTLFNLAWLFGAAALMVHHRSSLQELSLFNSMQLVQNTYFGPTSPVPGNPQLIRVEVIINDDPIPGGLQIEEVRFNNTKIPLKPRGVNGFRGQGSFQLSPGKYKLAWKLNRDKFAWPRTVSHEQIVNLDSRDLWVQITIEGEDASIR